MFRVQILEVLTYFFRIYWEVDFFSHAILFLFEFYPHLDYSKEREKLTLFGELEVALFDKTFEGLIKLIKVSKK